MKSRAAAAVTCGAATSFTVAAIGAACLTAASTAMAATTIASPPASTPACYNFAVGALRHHVVVHRSPPACAGLAAQEVNEAVARAVRTVVGPLPKAAARQQAVADSRYLASLVRPGNPGQPAPAVAAPSSTGSPVPTRLAALIVWLTAAVAGTRLLLSRLSHSWRGGRRGRTLGSPVWVLASHASLATAGLALWVAFLVTGSILIGWLDVAMTWLIAGLGMATLLADPPGQYAAAASASAASLTLTRRRVPALTIALHGALAATTMALVLIAVIGTG